jgi:hypothetical protein
MRSVAHPNDVVTNPGKAWYRFSLRTFTVAIAIACLLCGWIGNHFRQRREIAQLIANAKAQGMDVRTGDYLFGRPMVNRGLVGDLLSHLVIEDIRRLMVFDGWGESPELTRAATRRARRLMFYLMPDMDRATLESSLSEHTEYLGMKGTNLAADALAGLTQFPNLQRLWILDEVVKLDSLRGIAQHPSLTDINIQTKRDDLLSVPPLRCARKLRDFALKVVPDDYDWQSLSPLEEVELPTLGIRHLRFLEGCSGLESLLIENPLEDDVQAWIAAHFPHVGNRRK